VTEHRARIQWSDTRRTRDRLPVTLQYVTMARFFEDAAGWPVNAWSVVCRFDEPPAVQGSPSLARVRFLADAAPHERLKPGVLFSLYEGRTDVATVELLD
jgi:hypothetical protein